MYKAREGQWSWIFHRISGMAIFFFLFGHILSTSVVVWGPHGPDMHEKLDHFYRLPIFTLLFHPLLFGAVLFHSLNGIRIVVIDWWSKSTGWQRKLFYGEIVVFAAVFVLAVAKMIWPEWQDYQKMRDTKAAITAVQPAAMEGVR